MFGDNQYSQAAANAARNRGSVYAGLGVQGMEYPQESHAQHYHSTPYNHPNTSNRRRHDHHQESSHRRSTNPNYLLRATPRPFIPPPRRIDLHLIIMPQSAFVGYQVRLELWESGPLFRLGRNSALNTILAESGMVPRNEIQSRDIWSVEVVACGHQDVQRWWQGSREPRSRGSRRSAERRILGHFTNVQSENQAHWDWWVGGLWNWFPEGHEEEVWSIGVQLG